MTHPKFDPQDGIWIFGYASLMWKPEFSYLEARPALIRGYHRALCVWSTVYRGTPEQPGLVMGLDRGGSCRGRAFLLARDDVPAVMDYLYEREMSTHVYAPRFLNATLDDGRSVKAYCFTVVRNHQQYTGKLEPVEAAKIVRRGVGPKGSSLDYLKNTLEHLDDMGIIEGPLHQICELAQKGRK